MVDETGANTALGDVAARQLANATKESTFVHLPRCRLATGAR